MPKINGIGVAAVGGGLILAMSGIHGWGLMPTIQELLTGKKPSDKTLQNVNPITGNSASLFASSAPGYATGYQYGSTIASAAMAYDGGPYGWAQSGPPGTPNDCSGMVNDCLGRQLGMNIPGHPNGQYSGHGPATMQYYAWFGASTIPASQMQAGDLCCWPTHIGIALGPNSMISALDQSSGVVVTSVAGGSPGNELLKVRRILQVISPVPSGKPAPRVVPHQSPGR
jgi:cell wall-associated NlpC family hydrolase